MKAEVWNSVRFHPVYPQNGDRKNRRRYFFLSMHDSKWLRQRNSIAALCILNIMSLYFTADQLIAGVKGKSGVIRLTKSKQMSSCLDDIINTLPESDSPLKTNSMEISVGTDENDREINMELSVKLQWIGPLQILKIKPKMVNYTQETIRMIERLFVYSMKSAEHYRSKRLNDWLTYILNRTYPKSVIKGRKFKTGNKNLIDCIEETCRNFPDKTAVSKGNRRMTYRELQKASDRIASGLLHRKFRHKSVIGILMEQSPDYIAVILGVLKAGCICLPLDVRYPDKRISDMLRQGRTAAVIVDRKCPCTWEKNAIPYRELEEIAGDGRNVIVPEDADLFLYFTSGSTGTPKAVCLKNNGILNSIYTKIQELKISSNDRLSYMLSSGFVSSLWCCLGPAVVGAELAYADTSYDVYSFFAFCQDRRITIAEVTSTFLNTFISIDKLKPEALKLQKMRWLISTGEELSPNTVASFYALRGNRRPYILNAYGMTECSDDVLHYPVKPGRISRLVPLGRPACWTNIYLVDDQHRLLPQGIPGEIAVSGPGVTGRCEMDAGQYHQAEALHLPDLHGLLYLTGDQGIILNGLVYFLGRKNESIKISGFKVRLADVNDCVLCKRGVHEAYTVWNSEDDQHELLLCV